MKDIETICEDLIETYGISEAAKYPFLTGYFKSIISIALDRMTEEERKKFFPHLT